MMVTTSFDNSRSKNQTFSFSRVCWGGLICFSFHIRHNHKNKNMNGLISTSFCKTPQIFKYPLIYTDCRIHQRLDYRFPCTRFRVQASTNELDKKVAVKDSAEKEVQELNAVQLNPVQNDQEIEEKGNNFPSGATSGSTVPLDKDLKKVKRSVLVYCYLIFIGNFHLGYVYAVLKPFLFTWVEGFMGFPKEFIKFYLQ